MRQGAQGWFTGMTLRDWMGREEGGGFRMGNTCIPMTDSCECMAKPPQYCKVISLQLKLKKIIKANKINNEKINLYVILSLFLCMVWECYNFTDLHAAVQLCHYHLETIFSPLCSLASFVEDYLTVGMWVLFFFLDSLFCSTDPYVCFCASTTLFLCQYHTITVACNIV